MIINLVFARIRQVTETKQPQRLPRPDWASGLAMTKIREPR